MYIPDRDGCTEPFVYPCEECKESEATIAYTENQILVACLCVECYELFTGVKFVVPSSN